MHNIIRGILRRGFVLYRTTNGKYLQILNFAASKTIDTEKRHKTEQIARIPLRNIVIWHLILGKEIFIFFAKVSTDMVIVLVFLYFCNTITISPFITSRTFNEPHLYIFMNSILKSKLILSCEKMFLRTFVTVLWLKQYQINSHHNSAFRAISFSRNFQWSIHTLRLYVLKWLTLLIPYFIDLISNVIPTRIQCPWTSGYLSTIDGLMEILLYNIIILIKIQIVRNSIL